MGVWETSAGALTLRLPLSVYLQSYDTCPLRGPYGVPMQREEVGVVGAMTLRSEKRWSWMLELDVRGFQKIGDNEIFKYQID